MSVLFILINEKANTYRYNINPLAFLGVKIITVGVNMQNI